MSGRRFNNLYGLVSWLPGFRSHGSSKFLEPDGSDFGNPSMLSDITLTGQRVNSATSISLPGVWAALRNISEDYAKLDCYLSESTSETSSRRVMSWEHPVARLYETPNSFMSSFDYRQCTAIQLMLECHCSKIIRDGETGEAVELIPVTVKKSEVRNGVLVHTIETKEKRKEEIADEDMIVVKGMTVDGVNALNAIDSLKNSISLYQALIAYAQTFFGNGVHPSMILGFDPGMGKEQVEQTKKAIQMNHQGATNKQKVLALKGLVKAQQWTVNAEDAQLLTSMRFAVEDVARIWRIPPHKLMELSRSTNNNIEHQSREYLSDSILPKSIRIQQEYDRKLLTESERRRYKTLHDHKVILQVDAAARSSFYKDMFNMGALSPNEIREREGLNPRPGGDVYILPQNVAISDSDGNVIPVNKTEADQAAPAEPAASMQPFAKAMFDRIETRAWRTKKWNCQASFDWIKGELEPFAEFCDIDAMAQQIMDQQALMLLSETKETEKRAELFIKELSNDTVAV